MSTLTAAADATPAAPGGVLVIGQFRYGFGADLATAKRNFRRHGGVLGNGYSTVTFGDDQTFTGVDGIGRYHWRGNVDAEPAVTEVPPRRR